MGTGETARRLLAAYPDASLHGMFRRVAAALRPGGRFVLGDVVIPDDPADVITPIDGVYDQPSPIDDQLGWLDHAGLDASLSWRQRDLAVLVADR
jgi:tRNA (cmo5U34)-methyltransferase